MERNFSNTRLSIPESLMGFHRLLSRIFESKVGKSYTWQDREKNKTFSKPIEKGSNSQILLNESVGSIIN